MRKTLIVAGILSCCALNLQAKASVDKETQDYLRAYGWIAATQASASHLGFSDEELKFIVQGFMAAAKGDVAPMRASSKQFQEYLNQKASAYESQKQTKANELMKVNQAKEVAFFESLKQKPDVVLLPSGLAYTIEAVGSDKKPQSTESVTVHYEGKLISGVVFDSSKLRGEASQFRLDQVIPGFQEGLQLIGVGGKITLYVPSRLGYGDADLPGIEPGSTLIFKVELIDIQR